MYESYWGEIKDPVHGYVYITKEEKEIIDSYPVQRLRRLRQLAGSEYVYPGANHTRFEHCIGTMFLGGRVTENPKIKHHLEKDEAATVRIACLLHDVGHGPFSHVFEQLLDKKLDKTHEDMTQWIIKDSELNDKLCKSGFNASTVSQLAVGRLAKRSKAFLDQIVSSTVDVDKLDFIVRDTYHTGAEYGFIDIFRLIHALDVLNGNLAVDLGALSALESMIIARIESFKSIYFHRVGRAAQIMLAQAIEKADGELGLSRFQTPEEYLMMDDYGVWKMLRDCGKSADIIGNLERRKLLKCVYERTFYEKESLFSSVFCRENQRIQLRDEIADSARTEHERVTIDVPTVPSVPYHHTAFMDATEIPVFSRFDGERIPRKISEISRIIETLKGFMNIMRVYTDETNRDRVNEAATKILGDIPRTAKISY